MSTAPPESGQSDPCRVHIDLAAAARIITRCGRDRTAFDEHARVLTHPTACRPHRRLTAAATAERSLSARKVQMRIRARDLAVGDVLHINDWHLHVITIERDQATAVLTAEFAFLIHFAQEDLVTVQAPADAA
jgi:hypothetical protein